MMNTDFTGDIIIRQAEKADASAMMELIRELALFERAPDEVTVTEEVFIENGFGDNPVWWAYVAEVNGRLIGLALCYVRYSTWKGPRLYLEDILVTESWRSRGVGKMLFDQVYLLAQKRKYSGMNWQVLDWNERAIHFYKKYEDVAFDNSWINCSINFDSTN